VASRGRRHLSTVFHIAWPEAWDAALRTGEYRADSLATEGFIHCSTAGQWPRVLAARFGGVPRLMLLEIDLDRAGVEVRWENLEGGTELFPHLYGPLAVAAVRSVQTLST
jgi:uncharacterized protein (DUF952 family)